MRCAGGSAPRKTVRVDTFLDLRLREWLDELARPSPAAGAGPAVAIAAAMAAALVELTARLSEEVWPEAPGVAAQAVALRARLVPLAELDAARYREALETLGRTGEISGDRRDAELGRVLARATEAPLAIARAASDVAVLAAEAAGRAEGRVQPDAEAAAALAAACAQAAARLVEVNLSATRDDRRVREARAAAAAAAHAAGR